MQNPDKFRFRKLDNVGAADADDDRLFLNTCFVETGDLEALCDCENPRRLILGRTGSGKSALIIKLGETVERAIEVKPESLALTYISNSTILNFFSDLGVKMDVFFRLLWRHVFTVEILKYHFHIETEADKSGFIRKLRSMFQDEKHLKAIEYLKKWSESFWEETEYRIKEITTKLEEDLKASAGAVIPHFSLSAEGAHKLSEEQKNEVVQRAQHVVNQVQIRQLSEIIDLVKDVLKDSQKKYYIVIDRLDEDWIDERLRLRMIRALIETVKDFGRVRNAKIIVSIRWDLLDRVFKLTRDGGFQEEKYSSLYLPLEWDKYYLTEVLNMRINHLIQQRYTSASVTYQDILPNKIGEQLTIDYMLERTMMRPRDLICFLNCCIQKAVDRPEITAQMVRDAEADYSRDRFRSLADEWVTDYPNLLAFAEILRGRKKQIEISAISEGDCNELCLKILGNGIQETDELSISAEQVLNCDLKAENFRTTMMLIFFRVGLVGLKLHSSEPVTWVVHGRRSVARAEITEDCRLSVHGAFWRVLGIKH